MKKKQQKEIKIDASSLASLDIIDCNAGDKLIFSDGNSFNVVADDTEVNECIMCHVRLFEYRICHNIPCASRKFHLEKI